MVFPPKKYYYAIIVQKSAKKQMFWMDFQPFKKKLWMILNLVDIYQCHSS
jgi:hypothetical protein